MKVSCRVGVCWAGIHAGDSRSKFSKCGKRFSQRLLIKNSHSITCNSCRSRRKIGQFIWPVLNQGAYPTFTFEIKVDSNKARQPEHSAVLWPCKKSCFGPTGWLILNVILHSLHWLIIIPTASLWCLRVCPTPANFTFCYLWNEFINLCVVCRDSACCRSCSTLMNAKTHLLFSEHNADRFSN